MSTEYTLTYGNTAIAYQLTYAERETLAIHVHPDTKVMVEAPMDSDFSEIEKRVRKRAAWILRQQRNFRRYSFDIPPRQYISGETHWYLGRQYRLKVNKAVGKETVNGDREQIFVYVNDPQNRGRTKKILENWYRVQARKVFTERVENWFPRFERYGFKHPEVIIRRMQSRWGSCTSAGKITLNLKMAQMPKQFIDYVIVHELCHLIEHNHGAEFYALMTRIMPGWEELREKLNAFEF